MKSTYKINLINDGKEDIIVTIDGKTLLIEEEFYKSFGFSFSQMQEKGTLPSFLVGIGIMLAKAETND